MTRVEMKMNIGKMAFAVFQFALILFYVDDDQIAKSFCAIGLGASLFALGVNIHEYRVKYLT